MEYSSISDALIGGFISGTIASGFIWLLFRLGKLEWLWLICVVITSFFTFFFGPSLPNPLKMLT